MQRTHNNIRNFPNFTACSKRSRSQGTPYVLWLAYTDRRLLLTRKNPYDKAFTSRKTIGGLENKHLYITEIYMKIDL